MRAVAIVWAVVVVSLAPPANSAAQDAPLHDVGIFSDLDSTVRITLPPHVEVDRTHLRVDDQRRFVVLYEDDSPLKIYPFAPSPLPGGLTASAIVANLGRTDAAEVGRLVSTHTRVERSASTHDPTSHDTDGDGIPDALDVLLGARKLVENRAKYTEGYYRLAYPKGDVPRGIGVCSDTIVRAFRNAGFDLQVLVARDIRAAPSAYPFVRRPDPNIDHRRVKTLLAWFLRHVPTVGRASGRESWRPGDIVFLDTFPARPGPDHVGIVSDRTAPSGLPFVINNWTVGYVEGEMDLLPSIAVTHRFRMK